MFAENSCGNMKKIPNYGVYHLYMYISTFRISCLLFRRTILSFLLKKNFFCSKTCLFYKPVFMHVVSNFLCLSGISIVNDLVKLKL